MPEGDCVVCEVSAPACVWFWYSRSSNTARSCLNPVVLTLARLLETTAISVCCASRPVLAAHRAAFMRGFSRSGGLQELRGGLRVLVRALHRLDLQFEIARQIDHVHHRAREIDVARFEHAGGELHGRIGRRGVRAAGGTLEEAAALAHQGVGWGIHQLDAPD